MAARTMTARETGVQSRAETCAVGLLWTVTSMLVGCASLLITILCGYTMDGSIVQNIPWASIGIMPANSSDPHDYGRHVFFGLRSISVSINPSDAGTFKYMEPVTATASSGDGDVTGGEATPTCKLVLNDELGVVCDQCQEASYGTLGFMIASLSFTLIALVYSIQRLSKDGNTMCATGIAASCTFTAFVASLVGLLWFYEKCLDNIDGLVEDVSFYLAIVTTAVQLFATLIHITVPPWREPEPAPPQIVTQALPAQATPREEFWDVINAGPAAAAPPQMYEQQGGGGGGGGGVGPRVIYTHGGPPQVSNYGAYGYSGANAAASQMPMQYMTAPYTQPKMQGMPNNQVRLDYAYPIDSGYVREYVL